MDNAARTRQRVLAIFLPVTAVLYIGGEALGPQRHRPGDSDHGHRPQGAAHRSQAPGSARSVPQDAPSRGAVRCLGSVRAGKPASEVYASYSVIPKAMNM